MEEVPEPDGGSWAKAGPPSAPRKRPGFTFQAWLAVIAAAACLQLFRSAAEHARMAGIPRAAAALDALAAAGAIGLAVAAVAVVLRRAS
jgi:hypothetical protein